jgi:hypothetical protein
MPTVLVEDLLERCPMSPPLGTSFKDTAPALFGLVARVAQSKFARTRQFTVRGTKSWVADVDGVSRPWFVRTASHTVRWSWEATFRMVEKKKKKNRRR